MITYTSSIPGMCFSSSLEDVTFTIGGASAQVTVTLDGSDVIYDEALVPVAGAITLYDLSGLVTPYVRQRMTVSMVIKIVELDSDGATISWNTQTIKVVYAAVAINTTASDFCENYFLTLLRSVRTTAKGRLEYLHYIGTDTATCTARYSDGTSEDYDCEVVASGADYKTIDVSPYRYEKDGATLIAYTVKAGARKQEYVINFKNPDCSPVLIFDNSFGCDEIIYCTGNATLNAQYKFSQSYILNQLENYDIEETRSIKADTGVLTYGEALWAQDLFRARSARTLVFASNGNATVGRQVTLTDVKVEYTNGDTTLPRLTFTYQPSSRNHNVMDLSREGRIFDDTFDNTFE